MIGTSHPSDLTFVPRRRRLVSRGALALGALLASSGDWAQAPSPDSDDAPSDAANRKRTSIHQEIPFKAKPARIYDVLLSAKQFAAVTNLPATISPVEGSAFSLFGGRIVGRNIELVGGRRIVQAWRPSNWPPGVYSLVRFEIVPLGDGAMVVLDHSGFPEGGFEHLEPGWKLRYWDPLAKYLT